MGNKSLLQRWFDNLGNALLGDILREHQEMTMGRLDAIKTALDAAGDTAADEAAQVSAHFEVLREQVTELQATIDGMVANQVTDEEIAALAEQANALSATVESIDTEGDSIPEPEPVPEPEPAPES